MARRSGATTFVAASVPSLASSRRRVATFGLSALGLGAASVIAHNASQVMALRKRAEALRVPLDHDDVVGAGLGAPTQLWVLGDSASDGYGLQNPRDAFPFHVASQLASATSRRVEVTSLGRDGARVADVALEQAPLLQASADAVAILVGANDVFRRRSSAQVRHDTQAMIAAVRVRAPSATVVVAGCPDFGKAQGFPQPLRRVLGWRCRVTAKAIAAGCEEAGIPFVDIVPDTRPELFGEDGVHPSREGSVAMAHGVVACLLDAAAATMGTEV